MLINTKVSQYSSYLFVISQKSSAMSSQDYERLVTDLQLAKKQCNAEKLAHQATLDQLDLSYKLNEELQAVIKSQTVTIHTLHHQLAEKSNKLAEMADNYELQLQELKQFVLVKDRELQGIRGSLMNSNYDMIRLRIVSELELSHQDQIDQIKREVQTLKNQLLNEKQMRQTAQSKYEHIKQELEKQVEKYQSQLEEKDRKYMKQLNKISEKYEQQRISKKQIQKSLQNSQKRYQQLHEKYETEIAQAYLNIKPASNKSQHNFSTVFEKQSHRVSKLEEALHEKQLQIMNMKKKFDQQKKKMEQNIKDFEIKQKQSRQNKIQYEEHLKVVREKEKESDQITISFQKKIKNLKEDHQEDIRRVQKDNERKLEEMRQKMQRIYAQKENYSKNLIVNQLSPRFGAEQKRESSQKQRTLRQRIVSLQKLNDELRIQLHEKLKKAEVYSKQKVQTWKKVNPEHYKQKLKEANQQIVNLLLEKASLKQQITKLKQ